MVKFYVEFIVSDYVIGDVVYKYGDMLDNKFDYNKVFSKSFEDKVEYIILILEF